jgi:hypothetical protein
VPSNPAQQPWLYAGGYGVGGEVPNLAQRRLPEQVLPPLLAPRRGGPPSGGAPDGDDEGGNESSEYEGDVSDKGEHESSKQTARRSKLKRTWKKYNEFNGNLVFNNIPEHASKFKVWKEHVRAEITAVSKAGSKAFLWMLRIEDSKILDTDFRVPDRKWEPLDDKIRAALLKNIGSNAMSKQLHLRIEEERVQHNRQIAGGFMLRLIYRHFQTKDSMGQYYDFGDIVKVTFRGDQHLEDFWHQWTSTLNGLQFPEQLHEVVRKDMFLKQIKGSTIMKFDLEHYARMKPDDPDKSYEWLTDRVKDRINDNRIKRVEFELGYGGNPALAGTVVVCKFHAMGSCNRGDACLMSHEIPKGYVVPTPKGKGKDGKGKGKDDWSNNWTDRPKGKGKDAPKGKGKGKTRTVVVAAVAVPRRVATLKA